MLGDRQYQIRSSANPDSEVGNCPAFLSEKSHLRQ